MNYLSVCTVIKNEAPYLEEWLDFHIKQGVEMFYLFDNESTDNTKKVLEPYSDYITYKFVPGNAVQFPTINTFIEEHRTDSRWVAFIDADEFLFSPKEEDLKELISIAFDKRVISGIAAHWLLFGSNGHLKYTDDPVTRRFTKREGVVNPHVKSIMKMSDVHRLNGNVHCFTAALNIVDEKLNILPNQYAQHTPATADILRVNHYVTKSKEECDIRRALPRADTGELRSNDFFDAHNRNDAEDFEILKRI